MCGSKLNYERRNPERTLLYQTIAAHWETFKAEREMEGRTVPKYIAEEFENYLLCDGVKQNSPNFSPLLCSFQPLFFELRTRTSQPVIRCRDKPRNK